jgi:hypothetical protein
MSLRRMIEEAKQAAEVMAREKLASGQARPSVIHDVSTYLRATHGFPPKQATTRARDVVLRAEKALEPKPPRPRSPSGLYEAWRLPGGIEQEGEISATEARTLGAAILIAGAARKFIVKCRDNWGDDRFPWKLLENRPVGTLGAEDNYEEIDEFSTMTAARAQARAFARGAA